MSCVWVFSMKDTYIIINSEFEQREMWNSADESRFFLMKGQVKRLPDKLTNQIINALNQGILREATQEEVDKFLVV